MTSNTLHLFSTPLLVDTLASAEGIVALRTSIDDERRRDPDGVAISNIGGWHSNTQMIDWGGEAAKALAYKTMQMADSITIDVKSPRDSRFGWIPEMWANVSKYGASNQHHYHPGSYWSAVAYIDDGYAGDMDVSLGGELRLHDPRMPMMRMTAPDLRMLGPDRKPQNGLTTIRPKSGMIVLFPSWLQHHVQPFRGQGTRVSIAINLVAALSQQSR
ncbi:MAG: 2OG-Fe(II) oxygenase family protein [Pontixanthobacter sp.]